MMKDHRRDQLRQVEREGREFIEETTHEQFVTNTKRKLYPVGSTFKWAIGPVGTKLGSVYGPPSDKRKSA